MVVLDETTLTPTREEPYDFNPSAFWAAGAMISTVPDLMVWAKALAEGTLLTPAMQAARFDWLDLGFTFPPFTGGFEAIIGHDLATGTTIVQVQDANVITGEPHRPRTDAIAEVPDFVLPSAVGILGQPPGAPPTPPAAAPLVCAVPALRPMFTG